MGGFEKQLFTQGVTSPRAVGVAEWMWVKKRRNEKQQKLTISKNYIVKGNGEGEVRS